MRVRRPPTIPPGGPPWFPDPATAPGTAPLAIGGDLSPERVLFAYEHGIFAWYADDSPILWWSPDPRAVIGGATLHVSRRLQRTLQQGRFTVTWNRAFRAVVDACAQGRPEGTWIFPEFRAMYAELHRRGRAHSVEVWSGARLAGGLFGVQCGAFFSAESMFHDVTDASKVALVAAVRTLEAAGVTLIDVQFLTGHLASMGSVLMPRRRYLDALAAAVTRTVDLRAPSIVVRGRS